MQKDHKRQKSHVPIELLFFPLELTLLVKNSLVNVQLPKFYLATQTFLRWFHSTIRCFSCCCFSLSSVSAAAGSHLGTLLSWPIFWWAVIISKHQRSWNFVLECKSYLSCVKEKHALHFDYYHSGEVNYCVDADHLFYAIMLNKHDTW